MIYITGATGHIGNNLVKALTKQKIDFRMLIRKVDRSIYDVKEKAIIGNVFSFSFLDQLIKKDDIVIHLAAYVNLSNRHKKLTYDINVEGTKTIANICYHKQAKLVYFSTTDIFSSSINTINESSPINPKVFKTHYQQSKAIATNYVKSLVQKGLDASILYPSGVIGIHDYKPSPFLKEIKRVMKKRVLFYFKGGYEFIDVSDIVLATIKIINEDIKGDFILSHEYASIKDLYLTILEKTNHNARLICLPRPLIYFVKTIIPKLNTMINPLLKTYYFDNSKMLNQLNIKPITLNQTLHHTIEWILKEEENEKKSD